MTTENLYDIMLGFGDQVTRALNDAGVQPKDGYICAVMIVVGEGNKPRAQPVGCSINYENGKWGTLEAAEITEHGEDS